MAGSLVSLELSAAQSAEKWVLKWTDAEIMVLAKHLLTNQQKVAADAAAAAQQTTLATASATAAHAIVAAEAVADILSYAAVAAAAAAAAAAVAGPAAMAVAAGMAYTEVASLTPLAAFDIGTNFVPKTGIAMIHEGERIIPAADNRALMGALQGGGSRSSSMNMRATINNHYNNPGRAPSAREQAASLHNVIRRGHARA
jgi:hypothetical protein